MNEQVMYWIALGSNRPELSDGLLKLTFGSSGGLWMLHKIVKLVQQYGLSDLLQSKVRPMLDSSMKRAVGTSPGDTPLKLGSDGVYHVPHCSSPEYRCYAPFEDRSCHIQSDCNYELAQLRWGLATAEKLLGNSTGQLAWWQQLQVLSKPNLTSSLTFC